MGASTPRGCESGPGRDAPTSEPTPNDQDEDEDDAPTDEDAASSVVSFPFIISLASSSTSEKSSCLTARIEYAHTAVANPARTTPVRAFWSRKGARARWRPGDMTCVVTVVGEREWEEERNTYIAARPVGFADFFARDVRVLGHVGDQTHSLRVRPAYCCVAVYIILVLHCMSQVRSK